jgi:hypothetical protein
MVAFGCGVGGGTAFVLDLYSFVLVLCRVQSLLMLDLAGLLIFCHHLRQRFDLVVK